MILKRFYEKAHVEPCEGTFAVYLDGRRIKTPLRQDVLVPTHSLAEALAKEWNGQGPQIDLNAMLLMHLVSVAIDSVASHPNATIEQIAAYGASDLLCYRASEPSTLVERQTATWDPLLEWAQKQFMLQLFVTQGVMFVPQPEQALNQICSIIASVVSPFLLTSLREITTLTGSVVIGLALLEGHLTLEEAWTAAQVDEAYQSETWGWDSEVAHRSEGRKKALEAALDLCRLVKDA